MVYFNFQDSLDLSQFRLMSSWSQFRYICFCLCSKMIQMKILNPNVMRSTGWWLIGSKLKLVKVAGGMSPVLGGKNDSNQETRSRKQLLGEASSARRETGEAKQVALKLFLPRPPSLAPVSWPVSSPTPLHILLCQRIIKPRWFAGKTCYWRQKVTGGPIKWNDHNLFKIASQIVSTMILGGELTWGQK